MEGLAASVLLIAILLGVLLIIGGLVYLLAQRLPKRPMKPVNRGIGVASIILVLFVIVLWVGIKSASHPHPQPPVPLTCPTGPICVLLKGLCLQL